jgi:phenylpropionate dioxygenase-like ring-hydroxylating dioxygenase large terminal subunit
MPVYFLSGFRASPVNRLRGPHAVQKERIEEFRRHIDHEYERCRLAQYPGHFPQQLQIPVGRYVDPEFFRLEKERLWNRSWLLAAHVDELPEPGSFRQWTLTGDPVLLVRGKDARIRAFFNSCRHRGGALVHEPQGQVKVLKCRFHAWAYNLEGELLFVPQEGNFACLDKKQNSLVQLRCEQWGNLVFVNRDPDAPPLAQFLGRIPAELAHFEFGSRRAGASSFYELKCNWKIAVEAFLESYHVDTTHPQTVSPFLDSRGCAIELWNDWHSMMVIPTREGSDFEYLQAQSDDPRHELTRAGSINVAIFPNIHIPITEFSFPLMVFWPTGIDSCRIDVLFLEPGDRPLPSAEQIAAVHKQVDDVLREDFSNVEAQQRSYASGALTRTNIGYSERRIYWWHEAVDALIGQEHIAPALRIPALLGSHVS